MIPNYIYIVKKSHNQNLTNKVVQMFYISKIAKEWCTYKSHINSLRPSDVYMHQ